MQPRSPSPSPRRERSAQAEETIVVGTRKITITHPDRILFPQEGITKGDLCHYYRDVAHWLVPYLAGRPLTLQRWPDGIEGVSFFEKEAPPAMPDWIARTTQPSKGKREQTTYPLCNDAPSLLWFANLASITVHTWMSRLPAIESPDVLLLDLDPFKGCTVATTMRVALIAREELEALGLSPLVKTTGGKGLHVVVPLAPGGSYEEARELTGLIAHRMQRAHADIVTVEHSKSKRPRGTVYVDWAQVALGKTIVPPYVVRAHPVAPVSMPLTWTEVETLAGNASKRSTEDDLSQWNMATVPALLTERGDLWKKPFAKGQELGSALEKARAGE